MKPTKKEVYDLIKFCTEDNRVCIRPLRAGILWRIIEGDKQRDKPEIFDKIKLTKKQKKLLEELDSKRIL